MKALGCTPKSFSLPSLWIIYPVPWSLETLATRDTVTSDLVGLGCLPHSLSKCPDSFPQDAGPGSLVSSLCAVWQQEAGQLICAAA